MIELGHHEQTIHEKPGHEWPGFSKPAHSPIPRGAALRLLFAPMLPKLLALLMLLPVTAVARADVEFLAPARTFAEPVADPRWPRFAASWQEFHDDAFLGSAGAVAFGGSFAVFRDAPAAQSPRPLPQWEFGVQAAVFGTFEPTTPSQDLFNSDWQAGLYYAGRRGDFSGILRFWHQSSHLGDEFLLKTQVVRTNFTFESLSGLAAYEPASWSRIYAGGGVIFDETPRAFGDWFIQYGAEVRSPHTFANGQARPFAAIDVRHHQATDWQADVSIAAGVELRDPRRDGPTLRLMLEFYDGRSLNGQFFASDVRYIGAGLQISM